MSRSEVRETILRVPRIGGRTIHTRRRRPAASPGIAAIQYSWFRVNSYPSALSLGMMALGRNHATNASVRQNVVIHRVRHASDLSQVCSFSGSQDSSHSPLRVRAGTVLIGGSFRVQGRRQASAHGFVVIGSWWIA